MADEDTTALDRGDVIESAAPAPAEPAEADQLELELEEGTVEQEDDSKAVLIPKNRFDEAVAKERTEKERLAARLAEIEQREADRAVAADLGAASAKIKELIKEHTQLLADGELDKATDTMGSIIQLQSDMADIRSRAYADQGRTQAKSEIQYDAVVARLEMDYPEINPEDTENFDRDAVRRVQAYMTGLIQMDKMSPSKALQEAVTTILGAKRAEEQQTDSSKRDAAVAAGMRRKESAVTKAMAAQNQQPASLKDVGKDHDAEGGALDAAAVMQMNWEDFIKLPEETLSRMRGDLV